MKNVKVAKILEVLQSDGWFQVRCRGSHREFHHPTQKGTVTVNGKPNGTICGFLLKSIERQSGLNF